MKQLFYDEPPPGSSISWLGATPKLSPMQREMPFIKDNPDFHQTRASLVNVVRAEVYSDDDGASNGIVFEYADGSSECIGQRPVGLGTTKVTKIDHPRRIHARVFDVSTYSHHEKRTRKYECVEILLSANNSDLDLENWRSQDMVGDVMWSFRLREEVMKFSGPINVVNIRKIM